MADLEASKPVEPCVAVTAPLMTDNEEKPSARRRGKVLLETGIVAHLAEWMMHLVAVGISVGTTQLCFRQVYWTSEEGWTPERYYADPTLDDILKAIQYAAKFHEILLVGSVSAIVLHFVQRRLIGPQGVPFGLVLGAYELGSFTYLLSSKLWSSALRRRSRALGLLIAWSVLMSLILGPASAGVMQPNLNWWTVKAPFGGADLPMVVTVKKNEMYPMLLDQSYVVNIGNTTSCLTNITAFCPGFGYSDISAWAFSDEFENTGANITITEPLARTQRILSGQRQTRGSGFVAISSTISGTITRLYGLFWNYLGTHNLGLVSEVTRPLFRSPEPIYAPLVQVQCSAINIAAARADSEPVSFTVTSLWNFTDSGALPYEAMSSLSVPNAVWNVTSAPNTVNFTWIDASSASVTGGGWQPSIGALATMPYSFYDYTGPTPPENMTQTQLLIPCMIDARWAASGISFDPTTSNLVISNVSDPSTFFDNLLLTKADLGMSDPVRIDPAWAALLNVPGQVASDAGLNEITSKMPVNHATTLENILYKYVQYTQENDTLWGTTLVPSVTEDEAGYMIEVARIVAQVLSLVVADGLALTTTWANNYLVLDRLNESVVNVSDFVFQTGFNAGTQLVTTSSLDNDEIITMQVEQYGWGYGLGKLIIFDISVLYVHIVMVLAYLVYKLLSASRGRAWTSSSWGDTIEFAKLGLVSREAIVLRGPDGEGWRQTLRVRERGDGGGMVDLLVSGKESGPDPSEKLLKPGKKYI